MYGKLSLTKWFVTQAELAVVQFEIEKLFQIFFSLLRSLLNSDTKNCSRVFQNVPLPIVMKRYSRSFYDLFQWWERFPLSAWSAFTAGEHFGRHGYSHCICFSSHVVFSVEGHYFLASKVIPVYKSGDKTQPSNYRPISLLSHFFQRYLRNLSLLIYCHFQRKITFSVCLPLIPYWLSFPSNIWWSTV